MVPFVLITLLTLFVAVVMAVAVLNNFRVGLRFRDELARRVKFLRMDKMLTKRNIKLRHYLHTESITYIENQIRNCESCSEIKQCDQALKESSPADLSFCPNHEGFESITTNELSTLQKTQEKNYKT